MNLGIGFAGGILATYLQPSVSNFMTNSLHLPWLLFYVIYYSYL